MMWNDWVIDAGMSDVDGGVFVFVPVENIETNPVYVFGMNLVTSLEAFDQGNLRGVIHSGGQEAVEQWCQAHPEVGRFIEQQQRKTP